MSDALSNPSESQYHPTTQVTGEVTTTSTVPSTHTGGPVGTLPFTGVDVAILVAVAIVLVLAGAVMRRLSTIGR